MDTIPTLDKYVNVENILEIFEFIKYEAETRRNINIDNAKKIIEKIKPSTNIIALEGEDDIEDEIAILYYNIPRLFENILSAMGESVTNIQSGTILKDENINKYLPTYLQDKDTDEYAINTQNYTSGNNQVIDDSLAEVFYITKSASSKYIKDLPIGSIVMLEIQGEPTEFIVVNHGIPARFSDFPSFDNRYPRYDDTANGTWLLMKNVWEDPDPSKRFKFTHNERYPENIIVDGRPVAVPNKCYYGIKEELEVDGQPVKQIYSKFDQYFNTTFLDYFNDYTKDLIKEVNLPLQGCCIIDGGPEVGINKTFLKEDLIKGGVPFKTKIFPLSWTEMNWYEPYDYESYDPPKSNSTGGITYAHITDLLDGGILKYFEDNSSFRPSHWDIYYKDETIKKDGLKRRGKLKNGTVVPYNLRSCYQDYFADLASIDENGNLGVGPVEIDEPGKKTDDWTYTYRFRPALILPFETKIKTDEVESIKQYKIYADQIGALEWIERAKKLHNKMVGTADAGKDESDYVKQSIHDDITKTVKKHTITVPGYGEIALY